MLTKEIAERMNCSAPTVYGHLDRICEKTHCQDYHEVVAKLFSFACQARGHTPPDLNAFRDTATPSAAPDVDDDTDTLTSDC
jgi:hypothetical protein